MSVSMQYNTLRKISSIHMINDVQKLLQYFAYRPFKPAGEYKLFLKRHAVFLRRFTKVKKTAKRSRKHCLKRLRRFFFGILVIILTSIASDVLPGILGP